MSKRRVGFLCGCVRAGMGLALALLAGLQSTAARAREFRAADIQEENYPTVQALRYMDQLVTERTGGRHRIRVFHSRQLGEESQTIEQTRVGAIDLEPHQCRRNGDVAPELNVLALAVPVPLGRPSQQGPRRSDRRGNSWRARGLWLHRDGVLRFRRSLDLHRAATGARAGGPARACASACSNPISWDR